MRVEGLKLLTAFMAILGQDKSALSSLVPGVRECRPSKYCNAHCDARDTTQQRMRKLQSLLLRTSARDMQLNISLMSLTHANTADMQRDIVSALVLKAQDVGLPVRTAALTSLAHIHLQDTPLMQVRIEPSAK